MLTMDRRTNLHELHEDEHEDLRNVAVMTIITWRQQCRIVNTPYPATVNWHVTTVLLYSLHRLYACAVLRKARQSPLKVCCSLAMRFWTGTNASLARSALVA